MRMTHIHRPSDNSDGRAPEARGALLSFTSLPLGNSVDQTKIALPFVLLRVKKRRAIGRNRQAARAFAQLRSERSQTGARACLQVEKLDYGIIGPFGEIDSRR